jgi:hypothetical protein
MSSSNSPDFSDRDPAFLAVLDSASRLQALVPDAVVVGGTAAALYADHRLSTDHDHVLADLADRFEMVLDALEADGGWATNRIVPGRVILGSLDGIETGVRQMIRRTPLEVSSIELLSGASLRVPTEEETLRIKAFLVIRRNQTRDYLDVAALSDHLGTQRAGGVLVGLDRYYADQNASPDGVASQAARQLADPRPADPVVTTELGHYKRIQARWNNWNEVVAVCRQVATVMAES